MIITLSTAVIVGIVIFIMLAPIEGLGCVALLVLILIACGAIKVVVPDQPVVTGNVAVTVTQK